MSDHQTSHTPSQAGVPAPSIDPVCGMTVGADTPHRLTHDATEYRFCSASCTCPMHPEIVRDVPGSCPKCGMALEPRTVTAEEEENPELVDMTRRFWVSLVLTVPLLLVAMGEYVPGRPLEQLASPRTLTWVELLPA